MTNEQIFRAGERPRRRLVAALAVVAGISIVATVSAMSALPATQAQPVEASSAPVVKVVTAEHQERASIVIAEHLAFDAQLHDFVDTAGILGNSQNIEDALEANEDLQAIVTLDHTEYARAGLVGTLAVAIDREALLHANSHPEAVARLVVIRDEVLANPDAAFSTIGSPPLAEEIAQLLATIRG